MKNYIRIYYEMIINGDVTVSEKVRRLYAHLVTKLDDMNGWYVFDIEKANYGITFVESFCKHSKGKWAGKIS